jgi:hypothetical protein
MFQQAMLRLTGGSRGSSWEQVEECFADNEARVIELPSGKENMWKRKPTLTGSTSIALNERSNRAAALSQAGLVVNFD